ncbi:MAG: GapR family DNA-binding domain-containing protein, partial [Henriciella sp.]
MEDAPITNLTEASRDKLRQTVARIERLEEEKREVAE